MGSLSPWHWAILAVVIVLLFGAKRLPDASRSLGKSMRIFRAEINELRDDAEPSEIIQTPSAQPAQRAAEPTPVPNHTDSRSA